MSGRRNYLSLFSEEELKSALGLAASPACAGDLAAAVYAIPEADQVHFDWIDTTLMLLALVSDDCRRRVMENFGRADEEAFAERIADMERHLRVYSPAYVGDDWEIADVVYDVRLDGSG
jgi:hypothetical protein